jgi:hypothetical protein
MSTVPTKLTAALTWIKTRVPIWTAAGTTIGVDPLQIGELGALVSAAETALAEYNTALADAEAKGEIYRNAATTARNAATAQVVRIRGFARTAPNPVTVYADAQIPEPAKRAPSPPPGTPDGFKVFLEPNGDLRFTFKCDNPPKAKGVTYLVQRQNSPQGAFEFLKLAKDREFVDSSFPSTSSLISYLVTAQTATKSGTGATFTVRYGAPNQSAQGAATIVSQGPATTTQAS